MKAIRTAFAILFLLLSIQVASAQDTEPKPTETAIVEVTVEPSPVVEPAPTETVDEHNAWDDFLEAMGKIDVPTLALGIGLILALLRMGQPQTSADRQRTADELAVQRERAAATETQIDDLLITISSLINSLRRVEDALPAPVQQAIAPTQYTLTPPAPDAVVTTITKTTVDNVEPVEPDTKG